MWKLFRKSGLWVLMAASIGAVATNSVAQTRAKLGGKEIEQLVSGQTLRVTKLIPHTQMGGFYAVADMTLRRDKSANFRCTADVPLVGELPCLSLPGSVMRGAITRDVGTWLIKGDALCLQYLEVNKNAEQCFELWREGSLLRLSQVSGGGSPLSGEVAEVR